ncbi:MAG: NYN domain-containing protein [Corynebacterium sp.]|uniref:NYN domain-containing protein n=1 Tax=Corynebacterium sp. TaxID=1720 RepID=UPI0026DC73AE|nr:NYN domain-containing protein [Corynebacterium sp.]MDO4762300.1 NYN domain-containing protein [Corynebacterium sp.]
MLERTHIYVDTSYLLASFYNSWETGARAQLEIDLPEVVRVLGSMVQQHLGQPVHRQYWYDGIPDTGPHRYQRALRTCDGVQLRAGQLIEWGERRTQKAVDTRLVADMVLSAVRRDVTDIVLVSGDADMIPGVQEAVNHGIRVHLYGFGWDSMSSALRHACDSTNILDPRLDFEDCMQIEVLEGPLPPRIPTDEDLETVEDLEALEELEKPKFPDSSAVVVPKSSLDNDDCDTPCDTRKDDEGEAIDSCPTTQPQPKAAAHKPARTVTPADLPRLSEQQKAEPKPEPNNLHRVSSTDSTVVARTPMDMAKPAAKEPTQSDTQHKHCAEPKPAPTPKPTPVAAADTERECETVHSITVTSTTVEEITHVSVTECEETQPKRPAPNPSMMAPRRKLRSRYVPLPNEVWTSAGFLTPFDVGQQYAIWWYENAATSEQRDSAHLLSGGGLPPEIDRPLLQFACETLHEYTLTETQRVNLRDGFHSGIRGVLINNKFN